MIKIFIELDKAAYKYCEFDASRYAGFSVEYRETRTQAGIVTTPFVVVFFDGQNQMGISLAAFSDGRPLSLKELVPALKELFEDITRDLDLNIELARIVKDSIHKMTNNTLQ